MGSGQVSHLALLLCAVCAVVSSPLPCPDGYTLVESGIRLDSTTYDVCEDLSTPGGSLALVPKGGNTGVPGTVLWLAKSYEPYSPAPDDAYYLGLGKQRVLDAKWDMLGDAIVHHTCKSVTPTSGLCEPTWMGVERAVPVIRYSRGNKQASGNSFTCSPYSEESGVRTFTGSRSASVDATFSDHADDCTDNGFPKPQGYVMNLTAIANGEPPIHDFLKYVNFSGMAEGLVGVGGRDPNLIFYFPILPQESDAETFGGANVLSRYWTMIASPVPDMDGGREQSVWFRFQQIVCTLNSSAANTEVCKLHGSPQYYDTYWYSFSPITTRWIRPDRMANATGFYSNLVRVKKYWERELAAEGMMSLVLPETSASNTTNGTWLYNQATFSIVRSMISRDDTWHPRYGVLPGYGISLQDGFQDVFTSTATAALEWGAFPYARGVIDNQLKYYVRSNGMITYRAEELAQSGRMLTIIALYKSYTGDTDLLLTHFDKIKALAEWLLYRYETSLKNFPDAADPRHGIVEGGDEGDGFVAHYEKYGSTPLQHMYACAANTYRGLTDMARVWEAVAKVTPGTQGEMIAQHAKELNDAAVTMLPQIQRSINKTTFETGNPRAPRCIPSGADPAPAGGTAAGVLGDFRGYNELMFAGVLSTRQADDVFRHLTYGNESALGTRPMTLGCTGYNNKCATYVAYGMAYGLLQHDMVERFLLHYFALSSFTYTRGTWTTPEASHPDRDVGSTDYVAAGVHTAPIYLKWMLVFEDVNMQRVWLGKALPREWLDGTAGPVDVANATTRWGRVGYKLQAIIGDGGVYTVRASVSLPTTGFTPEGGLSLRIRSPVAHAGKMSAVTVAGKAWAQFNAQSETVNFSAQDLTVPAVIEALREDGAIVAHF